MRVVLVEDTDSTRRVITRELQNRNCTVEACRTIDEAIRACREVSCDLVISDLHQRGSDADPVDEILRLHACCVGAELWVITILPSDDVRRRLAQYSIEVFDKSDLGAMYARLHVATGRLEIRPIMDRALIEAACEEHVQKIFERMGMVDRDGRIDYDSVREIREFLRKYEESRAYRLKFWTTVITGMATAGATAAGMWIWQALWSKAGLK